jgi:hypothetical protein
MGAALTGATVMREAATGAAALVTVTCMTSDLHNFAILIFPFARIPHIEIWN